MAAAYRAVEFYSGIGGMHFALKSCGISVKIVAAIDINTTANEVYAYNFPDTIVLNRNIEGIKLDEFIKFSADIFTMSPPCQPFTRQGHQKASHDPRTKSFLHIMKIIRSLPKPPSYILMENVKGFEVSETREEFLTTLKETNYIFQEFLLSPTQFGVPNSRLRYFLVAVHKPLKLPFSRNDSIMEHLPVIPQLNMNNEACSMLNTDNQRLHCPVCNEQTTLGETKNEYHSTNKQEDKLLTKTRYKDLTEGNTCASLDENYPKGDRQKTSQLWDKHTMNSSSISVPSSVQNIRQELDSKQDVQQNHDWNHQTYTRIRSIHDFLEDDKKNFEEFLVPENILKKKVILMDIVQKKCNHCCCFTKGYGHYIEGAGSILQMTDVNSSAIFKEYCDSSDEEKRLNLLAPLGLRYFTPREIANILCFPKQFDFPATSTKQKYRLLGNSLNVLVVRELLKIMFASGDHQQIIHT